MRMLGTFLHLLRMRSPLMYSLRMLGTILRILHMSETELVLRTAHDANQIESTPQD